MLARFWNALRREPLVHFAAVAALLFLIYGVLRPSEQEVVVIERATLERLADEQASVLGRPLTEDERQSLIQRAIDDAVLLREAYKRGLDQDAVVQRHLVQKMRLVLGEEVPEPSAAELKAYLAGNRERYRGPPTVTLDHVFYAIRVARRRSSWRSCRPGSPIDGLGEPSSALGDMSARYTLRDLVGLVGPEVARRVFEAPVGEWRGPLRSERGVHFIRVAQHHPPSLPSFGELESYLRQDWMLDQQRRATVARLAELRQNYRIVVEPAPGTR